MKLPTRMTGLGQVMQLAFVPSDFDGCLKFWTETMGAGPFYVLPHNTADWGAYRGIKTMPELSVAFGHWDDMQIEIIQQHNDAPSPYRDWRQSGAEGLHHICVVVDDMPAAKKLCTEAGGEVIYAAGSGESEWCYVETGGGPGTLLEMVKHAAPSRGLMDMIREARRGWDGRDPIRVVKLS